MTRHTWNQINNQHEGELGHREQKHTQVHNPDISPPPGRCVLAPWKQHGEGRVGTWEAAQEEDVHREGAGRHRPRGRRRREEPGKRQEGSGTGGGRSQGRNRRDPEQEEHSRTQATAMMMAHGGANGGRRHGRRLQGADQRRWSRWRRSPRQRANEPGGCRGSGGPGWSWGLWRPRWRRRSMAEPERLRTQVELMGGRSPTEPVGWSDEVQPEERSPEAMAGRRPTKGEPEGRGSPVELMD